MFYGIIRHITVFRRICHCILSWLSQYSSMSCHFTLHLPAIVSYPDLPLYLSWPSTVFILTCHCILSWPATVSYSDLPLNLILTCHSILSWLPHYLILAIIFSYPDLPLNLSWPSTESYPNLPQYLILTTLSYHSYHIILSWPATAFILTCHSILSWLPHYLILAIILSWPATAFILTCHWILS
jgi:hypothetical protein